MKPFVALLLLTLSVTAADLATAQKLLADGRFADAKPQLERLSEGDPENAEIVMLLARCQRGTGDHKGALASFEKAKELAPSNVALLFEYGSYCLDRSGPEKSLTLSRSGCELLEQVLKSVPAHQGAREWLIGFYRNAPWIAGGSMKKALAHAEALAAQDPERSLELRVSLKLQDDKAAEALALAEEARKQRPGSYMSHYVFGLAAKASPTLQTEAAASFEKCLALEAPKGRPGHDEIRQQLGAIAAALGDKTTARKHFEAGLAVNPANKTLQRSLAALN